MRLLLQICSSYVTISVAPSSLAGILFTLEGAIKEFRGFEANLFVLLHKSVTKNEKQKVTTKNEKQFLFFDFCLYCKELQQQKSKQFNLVFSTRIQ
jgi:hypothetical protein